MAREESLLRRVEELLGGRGIAALSPLAPPERLAEAVDFFRRRWIDLIDDDGERLRMSVGSRLVDLRLPIEASTCACDEGSAPPLCLHRLAALVDVAVGSEAGEGAGAAEEVASLDEAALEGWGGRKLLEEAKGRLGPPLPPFSVDTRRGWVRFAFSSLGFDCEWRRGEGLAGFRCICGASDPCVHRLVAILAWQLARRRRPRGATPAPPVRGALRRDRIALAGSLAEELAGLIALGLGRLPHSLLDRLAGFGLSARGLGLLRLERSIAVARSEIGWLLSRDGRGSPARALEAAAKLFAQSEAVAAGRPLSAAEGAPASAEVGALELIGLGLRRWRGPAGESGISVELWNDSAKCWARWIGGIDPKGGRGGNGCEVPWPAEPRVTAAVASRSFLRLERGRSDELGELPGGGPSRPVRLGRSSLCELPAELRSDTFREQIRRVDRHLEGGLASWPEPALPALLEPVRWEGRRWDPLAQELRAELFDAEGTRFLLALPFAEENRAAIAALESLDPTRLEGIFGLVSIRRGELRFEPVSLLHAKGLHNLPFDGALPPNLRGREGAEPHPVSPGAAPSADAALDPAVPGGAALPARLGRIVEILEGFAEGGFGSPLPLRRLGAEAAELEEIGLATVAGAIGELRSALETSAAGGGGEPSAAPRRLLRAARALLLARELAVLEGARRPRAE
jgi:hypothetical protein